MSSSATFHPFTRLPPELRHQIWAEALADCITPAVFPYRDCWRGTASPTLDDLYPVGETLILDHKLFDQIPLKIPLVTVSREARAFTLTWLGKQEDVQIQRTGNKLVISNKFDPSRDVLYISPTAFEEFDEDPVGSWPRTGNGELNIRLQNVVRNLAFRLETLEDEDNMRELASNLIEWYKNVGCIFVIVNPDDEPSFVSCDNVIQDRWELAEYSENEPCRLCPDTVYQMMVDIREAIWLYTGFLGRIDVQLMDMKKC